MNDRHAFDEQLLGRLPLPLAQLCRRSQNAKTPLEQHLAGYYLWEATLKLLGATAVVEYAETNERDPQILDKLKNLARPSVGHWWEFLRRLVPVLADKGDKGFVTVRDLVLGRARDDMPRAAGLMSALAEALEGKTGARTTVRLTELFDRLVAYRNREIGHGAAGQRPTDYYRRMAAAFGMGFAQILAELDATAGRRLIYVGDVRRLASGGWTVERFLLVNELPQRLDPLLLGEKDTARLPRPECVYLEHAAPTPVLRSLHAFVRYDANTSRLYFLNCRRGKKQVEYLCYSSGDVLVGDLGDDQCRLLSQLLDQSIDAAAAATFAARSLAEETAENAGDVQTPLPAGRAIGEYELLSRLGQGGMGIVYRAWQPSLGRQVALKCLLRVGDAKSEARFAREIRALGRIEHPNVVKVFTSGADGDQWFYAMELIEGAELSRVCQHLTSSSAADIDAARWQSALTAACAEVRTQETSLSKTAPLPEGEGRLRPPPLPVSESVDAPESAVRGLPVAGRGHVRQVVDVMRQIADAVHALNEAGVVHRDIKPGNIMLTADGSHPVLMDLGLAQITDDADGKLTRTRQFVGTLRYASPEQVLAVGRVDRRTDVYSLGATLWELLTLRPFFDADDQTPIPELMRRIQYEEAPSLRKYNPLVARDLEAIVLKCLEKDPNRRYATAKDLADDLQRFANGEIVKARPAGTLRRAVRAVRKRPVRSLAILCVPLLLLGAAMAYRHWDANHRVKIEYHAAMVARWGVPEGVYPVTAEQMKHRGVTWKITKRGRLVEKVEAINGLGRPTTEGNWTGYLRHEAEDQRECTFLYHYNERGEIDEETALDKYGEVVWKFHYTTRTTGYFADKQGFPRAPFGTTATFLQIVHSGEGFDQEIRYLDKDGAPQVNELRVFRKRFTLNARGMIMGTAYLDASGNPALSKDGYASRVSQRDEQGNMLETSYFGLAGQPVLLKNGYAKSTKKYDDHGNRTEGSYFGIDGKPVLHKDGFAKFTLKYDDQGNDVETAYFGVDGRPTTHKNGYSKLTSKYDALGNLIDVAYFGVDGKPTLHKNGNARWTAKYDDRDHRIEATNFGLDGQRTLLRDGYAQWKGKYDARGNRSETTYFGLDGQPTLHKNAYCTLAYKYDEDNNAIEFAYFGVDGKPTLHKDGYARRTCKYDSRGNLIHVAYLGLDGKATFYQPDGIASWKAKYDEQGNQTEMAYFGVDGTPVLHKNGFAKFVGRFDAHGNLIETVYFGVNGLPTLHKNGFARVINKYDNRGRIIEGAVLGLDGNRTLHKDGGIAKWTFKYDERGNNVESAYFGVNDQPAMRKDGYAKWTAKYDERGNRIESAYFGLKNKPVLKGGFAKELSRFDEYGNLLESAYFDVAGKPVLLSNGYAKIANKYDSRGNCMETVYFDVDGRPTLHKDGHARSAFKHDHLGNDIETAYFGLDGRPTLIHQKIIADPPGVVKTGQPPRKAGYFRLSARYDTFGNAIEKAYFDVRGRPALCPFGYAKIFITYDERGNHLATDYFGLDGTPTRSIDGYARFTALYDSHGNRTEAAYFDEQGQPTAHVDGNAKLLVKYDERGNMVEAAYLDAAGQPARIKSGYTNWSKAYDNSGNLLRDSFWGFDGKQGYYRSSAKYNSLGQAIELAYLDSQGKPARHKDGFTNWTKVFDSNGNLAERSNWGFDGSLGFFRVDSKYDSAGNMIEKAYLDNIGKPARHTDGYTNWSKAFESGGKLLEDSFWGYDGKQGYYRVSSKYNRAGQVVERAYLDYVNKPARIQPADNKIVLQASGKLVKADPFDTVLTKSHRQVHKLRVTAGAAYTIDLESIQFDAYLRLEDSTGKQLDKDDDGGNDLNARIVYKALKNGTLRIVATTYKGDTTGTYSLTVHERPAARTDSIDDETSFAGYTNHRNVYDNKTGMLLESSNWGYDGKQGYQRVAARYSEQGQIVELSYQDETGQPAARLDGCSKWTAAYGASGIKTEMAFFDRAGKPLRMKNGVSGWVKTHDENGNVVAATWRGYDGSNGYWAATFRYDKKGNITEGAYFDETYRPTRHKDGFQRFTRTFDERGRKVMEVSLGFDGKLGYVKSVNKFDDREKLAETTYFDEADNLARHANGYAKWTAKYDKKGNRSEVAYFDEKGHLASHVDGYAKWIASYDDKNNHLDTAYRDTAGKPVRIKMGYALVKYTLDDRGNRVDSLFFDEKMRPVTVATAIIRLLPDSQALRLGLLAGDVLVSYGDMPVKNSTAFIHGRTLEPKKGPSVDLTVLRNGKPLTFAVSPGQLGVELQDRVPARVEKKKAKK